MVNGSTKYLGQPKTNLGVKIKIKELKNAQVEIYINSCYQYIFT